MMLNYLVRNRCLIAPIKILRFAAKCTSIISSVCIWQCNTLLLLSDSVDCCNQTKNSYLITCIATFDSCNLCSWYKTRGDTYREQILKWNETHLMCDRQDSQFYFNLLRTWAKQFVRAGRLCFCLVSYPGNELYAHELANNFIAYPLQPHTILKSASFLSLRWQST